MEAGTRPDLAVVMIEVCGSGCQLCPADGCAGESAHVRLVRRGVPPAPEEGLGGLQGQATGIGEKLTGGRKVKVEIEGRTATKQAKTGDCLGTTALAMDSRSASADSGLHGAGELRLVGSFCSEPGVETHGHVADEKPAERGDRKFGAIIFDQPVVF